MTFSLISALPSSDEVVRLFEQGVALKGIKNTDPVTLASLFLRTKNTTYGKAAAANLAAVADDERPPWLEGQNEWDAPTWLAWDLTNTTFAEPARFSGCTDYGLLAYLMLKRANFDLGWSPEQAARFKKVHQVLCYVWFGGAWNQGEWMGLGNSILVRSYPDTASQRTPWMYPGLTREQHAEKVY